MSADGAALIAAAVQAAIHAKAPRRTVAAVAAAVASAFARPVKASAAPTAGGPRSDGAVPMVVQEAGSSAEEMLESLREHRRAQRKAKKERRRAAKAARRADQEAQHAGSGIELDQLKEKDLQQADAACASERSPSVPSQPSLAATEDSFCTRESFITKYRGADAALPPASIGAPAPVRPHRTRSRSKMNR